MANVRIAVTDGQISHLMGDCPPRPDDVEVGIAIPGVANAHSHAFQRALVGRTERRGPTDKDTFWTWRNQMYALTERMTPDVFYATARQAYVEMVCAGYTSVAEFHYLHHSSNSADDNDSMLDALAAAARDSGIRMTYVPILYERAGFTEPAPTRHQRRFVRHCEDFIDHFIKACGRTETRFRVGIGVHSLRAVSAGSLGIVSKVAAAHDVPMHIHISEQQQEVDACISVFQTRPVQWLTDNFPVDDTWCLVHATHVDHTEIDRLIQTGCIVCLCPTTEANLGDGLFPLAPYLDRGGSRLAIGSDSHVSIDPFEELRWLEYGQRLATQCRNVAAPPQGSSGERLFDMATAAGARACGVGTGRLEVGSPADLVVLDDRAAALAGHSTRSLLDAVIFSGAPTPIDRVMINGQWLVIDGRHIDNDEAKDDYLAAAHTLNLDEVRP